MMKRISLLLYFFALIFAIHVHAQDRKLQMHAVAFYNLENLFDTCHDEGKNDWAGGYTSRFRSHRSSGSWMDDR